MTTGNDRDTGRGLLQRTIAHLRTKKHCLFLTTSNRWSGETGGEQPKSSRLAHKIADTLGPDRATVMDVAALKIYTCEGNVSTARGNTCGRMASVLKDPEKNPTGWHRCWASFNNPDDELWRISRELFRSDCVVFFGSVRWGQLDSVYQKLIERLTWIENRHSTLGEDSIVGDIDAGVIAIGQNWNGRSVVDVQKQVLGFYGFNVVDDLCWNWQFTDDPSDESKDSYKVAIQAFEEIFLTD